MTNIILISYTIGLDFQRGSNLFFAKGDVSAYMFGDFGNTLRMNRNIIKR